MKQGDNIIGLTLKNDPSECYVEERVRGRATVRKEVTVFTQEVSNSALN